MFYCSVEPLRNRNFLCLRFPVFDALILISSAIALVKKTIVAPLQNLDEHHTGKLHF